MRILSTCLAVLTCSLGLSTASALAADEDMLPSHVWQDQFGNYQDDLGNTYVPDLYGNLVGPDNTLFKQDDGSYKDLNDDYVRPDGSGGYNTEDGYNYMPDGNGGYILND